MAARITRADIDNALSRVKRAHDILGITRTVRLMDYDSWDGTRTADNESAILSSDDLRVDIGSQTYGRAYRLYYAGPSGAHFEASRGYLGMTARETYDALTHYVNGLWDAINAMNGE